MKEPRVKIWFNIGDNRAIYTPLIALIKGMARGAATVSDYEEFPDENGDISVILKPKRKDLIEMMTGQVQSYGIRCKVIDRWAKREEAE